jgi:hypothetical protein
MPYVYQDAKRLAAMPIKYEKMGTAIASCNHRVSINVDLLCKECKARTTNATATARRQRNVHTLQPRTVCECRCRECRKNLTKSSFAAVCEYSPPALCVRRPVRSSAKSATWSARDLQEEVAECDTEGSLRPRRREREQRGRGDGGPEVNVDYDAEHDVEACRETL